MSSPRATFVVYCSANLAAAATASITATPEFVPGDPADLRATNADSLFVLDSITMSIDNTAATAASSYQLLVGATATPGGYLVRGDAASGTSDTVHIPFTAGYPLKAWGAEVSGAASTDRTLAVPRTIPVRIVNGAGATNYRLYIAGHVSAHSSINN